MLIFYSWSPPFLDTANIFSIIFFLIQLNIIVLLFYYFLHSSLNYSEDSIMWRLWSLFTSPTTLGAYFLNYVLNSFMVWLYPKYISLSASRCKQVTLSTSDVPINYKWLKICAIPTVSRILWQYPTSTLTNVILNNIMTVR